MRQESIESIEYRDYQINVYRDDEAESPRDNCDYTSHFWSNSRRNTFDSRRESSIADIVDENKLRRYPLADSLTRDFYDSHIWVPVYLYDHSGQSVSTGNYGDPWDSGLFGILAEDKDEIRKEFGCKRISPKLRKKIEDRLTAEVEEVDDWLTGNVYGYTVTPLGDTEDVLDSCWGFIGDYTDEDNYLMEYAKGFIDSEVEHQNKKAEEERLAAEEKSCEFWSGENAA